jgi:serine/tyrosine/threonine adenylyltransferase
MKHLQADTSFLETLHLDFYSLQSAKPLIEPQLVSINKKLCNELGFTQKELESDQFLDFINGKYILEGTTPYSSAYSGHQFGYFVPNLGDGRALNLGKLNNYHLQLKGSGTTPYSRHGDGRAVLRSSIREYLISEAIYGLGIPTTRAAAIITSKTKVMRNYEQEPGSIVLRASTSWIRFGTFEFAYLDKNDKKTKLQNLADYVIKQSYPEIAESTNRYEELYFAIVDNTIELIAKWQSIGFMHGVMNTDNMSIEGLTIDYGPYAFMEEFDKSFICNLSDHEGRYSFENQPFIAQWNLSVLAKVLSPIADHKLMESYTDGFIGRYKKRYLEIMKEKLGLYNKEIDDTSLILRLFSAMQIDGTDYTSFFYKLSHGLYDSFKTHNIKEWLTIYQRRLESETISSDERKKKMLQTNPKYILRNYMLQDAIDAAEKGDYTLVNDFLEIAHNPYGDFLQYEHYCQPKPDFQPLKCSCSS